MPRSLVDLLERHGGAGAVMAGAHPLGRRLFVPDALPGSLPHFACRCGRRVAAFMMRDLAPDEVPAGQRLTADERAACGFGSDMVRCDACCEAPVLTGAITEGRLREARGDPPRHLPETHRGRGSD